MSVQQMLQSAEMSTKCAVKLRLEADTEEAKANEAWRQLEAAILSSMDNNMESVREFVLISGAAMANTNANQEFRRHCAKVLIEGRYRAVYSHKAKVLLDNTGLNEALMGKLAEDSDPKIRETVRREAGYYDSI